jgi:hypothetical protein
MELSPMFTSRYALPIACLLVLSHAAGFVWADEQGDSSAKRFDIPVWHEDARWKLADESFA